MAERCCKTCTHLSVQPGLTGKRIVFRDRVYPCTAPVTMPALPDSMTQAHGFRWPPGRQYMPPYGGSDCPTWSPQAEGKP